MSPGGEGDGVVVTGSGRAGAAPDVVRLALASEGIAAGAQEALDAATAGVAAMREALAAGGVAVDDVRTTATSLRRDLGPDGRGPVRHTARLGLEATVRDVPAAGALLGAALAAAGDAARLDGLAPAHSDDAALAAAARALAFADARARAEQYAALAGRTLGEIRGVAEGGAMPGVRALAASAGAGSVPVEPGAVEVVVTVTVHWSWG